MKNNKIVNLTQHSFTIDQLQDIESRGLEVVEIDPSFKTLLNFSTLPNHDILLERATAIADIAYSEGADFAMIGGAPYFMSLLEKRLFDNGVKLLYAFSVRSSVERPKEDGTVEKLSVFKHLGFIEPKDTHKEAHQQGFDEAFSHLIG